MGIYKAFAMLHPALGVLALLPFVGFTGSMSLLSVASIFYLREAGVQQWMVWRQVFVSVVPVYVCVCAPAVGLFIRQAMARQRELLADADAVLLTRDPEGLALALAKIGGWRGPGK